MVTDAIRLEAESGDDKYAVPEIQLFGQPTVAVRVAAGASAGKVIGW